MSTPNEPTPLPSDAPKKKRGCLFYGCLGTSLFAGLLVLGIALLLVTCLNYSIPADAQLIQEFQQKRPALERLKTLVENSTSDNLSYEQYALLLKSVRCGDSKDIIVNGPKRNKQGFIIISVWGFDNCASSHYALGTAYCYVEKGYAYCPRPPDPKDICQELDDPPPQNSGHMCYRHLEGNWYLYREMK